MSLGPPAVVSRSSSSSSVLGEPAGGRRFLPRPAAARSTCRRKLARCRPHERAVRPIMSSWSQRRTASRMSAAAARRPPHVHPPSSRSAAISSKAVCSARLVSEEGSSSRRRSRAVRIRARGEAAVMAASWWSFSITESPLVLPPGGCPSSPVPGAGRSRRALLAAAPAPTSPRCSGPSSRSPVSVGPGPSASPGSQAASTSGDSNPAHHRHLGPPSSAQVPTQCHQRQVTHLRRLAVSLRRSQ